MPGDGLRRFLVRVLPLLLWMALIFSLSTDHGSSEHTQPLVAQFLERFFPTLARQLGPSGMGRIDWDLRKTAHIVEYAILAILAFRAVTPACGPFRSRYVIATLLFGIVYAASDEWHQSFVPSRGAAAADIVFDSFGVVIGTLLCLWRGWSKCARASAE